MVVRRLHAFDERPDSQQRQADQRKAGALRGMVGDEPGGQHTPEERHGEVLEKKGFVYAPDYVTNAGGTIFDTDRLGVGGVSHERGKEKVARIYETMLLVFEIAGKDKIPTYLAADRLAEERIRQIAKVKHL